jgi:hypothetical protein
MINLILFGTWEYEWMIPPHAALMAKYAPGLDIIYYSDRQVGDLPDNVEFRRSPHLNGSEDWSWAEDTWGPFGGFGVGFRACMEEYGQDVALFTFGDFVPISPVNVELLEDIAAFIPTQPDLMRIQAAFQVGGPDAGSVGQASMEWRGIEIRTISTIGREHQHMGGFHWFPSLWNVPLLLDFLILECSHWGFEASHQQKMMNRPDLWSGWPARPAYQLIHIHDRKEPGANLQYLSIEDFEIARTYLRPGTQYYRRDEGWKTK